VCLHKVNMFGRQDDGKESQTVVCSEAESVATIAPGNVSSAKRVLRVEGKIFV
jgi:hypothetical protein